MGGEDRGKDLSLTPVFKTDKQEAMKPGGIFLGKIVG